MGRESHFWGYLKVIAANLNEYVAEWITAISIKLTQSKH